MNPVAKKPLTGIAVLLVDDYPMNVLFAKNMLERLGALVDVAADGREALEKLDTSRHQIVLMDIQMPVMDGYESARLMRARGAALPIIALTADTRTDTTQPVRAAGMNGSLGKPFRPDSLAQYILDYLKPASY